MEAYDGWGYMGSGEVQHERPYKPRNKATNYSAIPNPGVTGMQRLMYSGGAGKVAGVASLLTIDWPTHLLFAGVWGPIVTGALITAGAFCMFRVKKSPFELAIMEFNDLGLSPEVIGAVIVENRAKAHMIFDQAEGVRDREVRELLESVADETLDMIKGFRDDPTDVGRSRSTLHKCLDQTLKIVEQYKIVENRDQITDAIRDQTIKGLTQINDAMEEQHRRNSENNTTALAVDLEVSETLLNALTK